MSIRSISHHIKTLALNPCVDCCFIFNPAQNSVFNRGERLKKACLCGWYPTSRKNLSAFLIRNADNPSSLCVPIHVKFWWFLKEKCICDREIISEKIPSYLLSKHGPSQILQPSIRHDCAKNFRICVFPACKLTPFKMANS